MAAIQGASPAGAAQQSADVKIRRAGAQFEAILLNKVLGDLEHAFTDLPGKKEDHSTQVYSGFAMQALASGLADAGGIGLGRMVGKALAAQAISSPGSKASGQDPQKKASPMVKAF